MIRVRGVPEKGQNCNGQTTENGLHTPEWRHPEVPKRSSPGRKESWNVIEISSSSENEEEHTQTPSPGSVEENGTQSSDKECCVRNQGHNMLRRDYPKKIPPFRIFQMPPVQTNVARKEEFYNYLGIYTKPPYTKAVDMSAKFLKRRSLRVCFINKRKEHTEKMSAQEKPPPPKIAPESPITPIAKDSGSTGSSPVTTDSSTTIMDRRNYIQLNSPSDDPQIVTHKVSDLSHQDVVQGAGRSITEKTAKVDRVKNRKNLRKRKRIHKKLYKNTYFIRSTSRSCVLRSGKVRDPDLSKIHLIRKLQKQQQRKPKEAPPDPPTKPLPLKESTKSNEIIILTDDEDAIEIIPQKKNVPKEEKVVAKEVLPKEKVLDEVHGEILGVHLAWPALLIFQKELISFWTWCEIKSILTGRQDWKKVGDVKRMDNNMEVTSAIDKRILRTDKFGWAYVEMRARHMIKIASQEADYTAMYINVYYLENGKGAIRTIELDRVCSVPQDMCYTTVPDFLSFIVTWHERVSSTKSRTGAVRYTLMPDLETLASIWDFNPVDHRVRSLSVATEQRVIGVGESGVCIWNYTTATLLIQIDLKQLELGDNLFTYIVHEQKSRYLILTQLHSNTIHTVAINLMDCHYRTLHTHENINLTIDSLRSATTINGLFVGAFDGGEMLLLKVHESAFLRRKNVDTKRRIFISGEYIVEIGEVIAIRSLMEFLAVCECEMC